MVQEETKSLDISKLEFEKINIELINKSKDNYSYILGLISEL